MRRLLPLLACLPLLVACQTVAPAAATDQRVLWTADMEEGSLDDWNRGETEAQQDSGIAESTASQEEAHEGEWSARLEISTPPESGARLFRWDESRRNRDLVYEAWLYIPEAFELTGSPETGRYWNLVQFKSISEDGSRNDPIWHLDMSVGPDGEMRPEVVWWPRDLEGPRPGQSGYRTFRAGEDVTYPVGRWFPVRARLRQSADFDGIVEFWVDGEQIFSMEGVRTGYESCRHNDWCVDQTWSVNLYSDGLAPNPSVVYIDSARIEQVDA